jgi:hypothetical protein
VHEVCYHRKPSRETDDTMSPKMVRRQTWIPALGLAILFCATLPGSACDWRQANQEFKDVNSHDLK